MGVGRVVGRWVHVLPLLAGVAVLVWGGVAVSHVGKYDGLLKEYRNAVPCPQGRPAQGCYAWTRGRVTAVQRPSAQDSATHVTLALADGSAAEAVLWKPPVSFDGIAVGESASIGTIVPGSVMDLRRDATGAQVHAGDYPGYWKAPFVVDGILAAVVGLPLLAWAVRGLWPRRRGYPFWAPLLLPAGAPALLAGGDMWEAPHPLGLGEYLPTVATAAVGFAVGVLLSVWAAHRSDRVKDSSPWLGVPSLK